MALSVRPATESDVTALCATGRPAWPETYWPDQVWAERSLPQA